MLKLTNVKKQYHTNIVIDIPFFELKSGIYWLNGTNGSGKTTLLKMIAALLPFEGEIVLNNIDLKAHPVKYRQLVGWAEAEPLFPTFMTGKEMIFLYQKIRKASKQDTQELLHLFQMNDYIDEPIGSYSAGMIKKLSLVLALLGNLPLIVLDEPLITLDADSIEIVTNLMLRKSKTAGTSFLMSSHQELQQEIAVAGKRLTLRNRTILVDEPIV